LKRWEAKEIERERKEENDTKNRKKEEKASAFVLQFLAQSIKLR
jgi:hypothetical protein